jgi:2-polyprenyl-3-methyl-5-hydroxy-6-metoxy-1,4-benzoquinol methylase
MNMPLASLKRRISRFATTMARRYGRLNCGMKAKSDGALVGLSAETTQWLEQNRLERMDATLDMFDEKRREFHLDRYRFTAARVQGQQVLDCACGTGYGVRLLREQGLAAQVIGVDVAAASIQYAWRHHGVDSALYLCASAERLPLADASVDVVTSFETLEHVPDDYALIEEFHRVLRPNGALIVSTPNQWPLADTPFHIREYDRASLVAVLASRFDCLELYNQNSGSDTPLNHGQARGIVATTLANEYLAECFVAVCRRKP